MRDKEARKHAIEALDRVARLEAELNDYRAPGGYTWPGLISRVRTLQETVNLLIPVGYEVVKVPSAPAYTELRKKKDA